MSIPINNGKIEGVPDGWRLVAFRRPQKGEWFISAYTGEVLELIDFGPFCSVAIVVPDNVYGVDDPMKDVLAPHGYQAVAFRAPQDGESWISRSGAIVRNLTGFDYDEPRVIIEPLPPPPKPKRSVLVVEVELQNPNETVFDPWVTLHPKFPVRHASAYHIEERDA